MKPDDLDSQKSTTLDEYEIAWDAYRDISDLVAEAFSLALNGHPNPDRAMLERRDKARARLEAAKWK